MLEAKRRSGAAVLDLTESNPTKAGFDYPFDEILRALADPRSLVYEPSPAGSEEARSAVAGYYARRGHVIDPQRVLLTASTSEAYAWIFKLLADPGDEVLAPQPSYPLFEFLAGMESVRFAQYPLVYRGRWSLDVEALERAVTDRTRAVVLVNPNNPTGSFLKTGELVALIAACKERNLAIISDEVFADYSFLADSARVATLVGVNQVLTFCLSGLSKVAGLPQAKLGWIVIGGPDALVEEARARLELIADTFLPVGTSVQHALPRLLNAGERVQPQIVRRVRENLAFLESEIFRDSGCGILQVEGGWYATIRVPSTRSEESWVLQLLEEQNVLVQPGFFYDFDSEAFLVLSLLTDYETFREGVRRLVAMEQVLS